MIIPTTDSAKRIEHSKIMNIEHGEVLHDDHDKGFHNITYWDQNCL